MSGPRDHSRLLQQTTARYRGGDRFTWIYVACKLRMDPVHRAVLGLAAEAPFGSVIDAGSGRGQLGLALLLAGGATAVLALDQDAAALAHLQRAAAGLPLRTAVCDLSADDLPETADTVLLIDVLYQLSTEAQLDLLARATRRALRRIIIRTPDPDRRWRSRVSAVMEWAGRGVWPTFGTRVNPLPLQDIAAALVTAGFEVSVSPCAQGTPLAGMLLTGRRVVPAAG